MFVLFCTFEALLFVIEQLNPSFKLNPLDWLMLAFAASLGGRAVSILAIGEWLRWPLTKVVQHSSGAGEDVEPRYGGWRESPGILLSCPICAGTWVGMAVIGLMAVFPAYGRYVLYALSAGGAAMVISRLVELIENARYVMQEVNGHWNRRNIEEQREPLPIPVRQTVEHAVSKVDITQ